MPVVPALSYPGVYVQEIPSGVRTIAGVATSITAFIGRALRGPTDDSVTINSYADFERIFGGLWVNSPLGYAVRDFYLNGGAQAVIVRLYHPKFASRSDRDKALQAAKATAAEATGTEPTGTAAADKVKAKADTFTAEPEKSAAKEVADAAKRAADAGGTAADVKKAAEGAVDKAAPITKAALDANGLGLEAKYEGAWGNALRARIDIDVLGDKALQAAKATAAEATGTEPTGTAAADKVKAKADTFAAEPEKSAAKKVADAAKGAAGGTAADVKKATEGEAAKQAPFFNLSVRDDTTKQIEIFRNVTITPGPRQVDKVVDNESQLVRVTSVPQTVPSPHPEPDTTQGESDIWADNNVPTNAKVSDRADDGAFLADADFSGTGKESNKLGLYALEKADLFNILCIPPYLSDGNVEAALVGKAAAYCEKRRAMLLVDPRAEWDTKDKAKLVSALGTNSKNAALFFPHLRQPNPLRDNQVENFVPCGAVAGVMARTDSTRGVWKAPAGFDATLVGVPELRVPLTDLENGELNKLAVNCLRAMPAPGRVVWGSRTLQGDDRIASEWKYIPVRRTALFIEESLYRGTHWVVFEPNDEPLWAQIRLNIGAFMQNLFRQGAFQGKTPQEAYFVKCDKETTTQNDINLGIVNIIVGFAPLKPAEFVIIYLQQIAGQIQT
jgi:uncharacterized protein